MDACYILKNSIDMLKAAFLNILSVKAFPHRFLHGAASLALLCVALWILPFFGSPVGRLQFIIVLAAAVFFPLLVTPSAYILLSKLGNLMGWGNLHTSNRTLQSSGVPEAISAILQLTHGSRGIGCGYRKSCPPPAYNSTGKGVTLSSLQAAVTIRKAVVDNAKVQAPLLQAAANGYSTSRSTSLGSHKGAEASDTYSSSRKSGKKPESKSTPQPAPLPLPVSIVPQRSVEVSARVGGGSLKAPVGLSRCTIVEDAPFPPPNTQVVMELHEKTLRVGGRRLRYRGYRPADRLLPLPLSGSVVPAVPQNPLAAHHGSSSPCDMGVRAAASSAGDGHSNGGLRHTKSSGTPGSVAAGIHRQPYLLDHHGDPCHSSAQPTHLGIHQEAAVETQTTPASSHALKELGGFKAALGHMRPYQADPQVYSHHQPYGQHLSLSIKVPWGDPSALPAGGGGLLESLNAALASGSGYMVVGAAVRPGCVLLQLDLMATSGTSADVLRRINNTVTQPQNLNHRDHGGDADADAVESSSGELAAQLARHVSMLAPMPPDGSEALVSLGGRLLYAFSYDEPAAEWTAVPMAWDEKLPLASGSGSGSGNSFGTQAALLQHLQGPPRVQLRSEKVAVAVPRGPQRTLPHMLMLTLQIEVADEAAAAQLTEELRPLLLLAHKVQQMQLPRQQQEPRHGTADGWQLVANCIGRSLPLLVHRVAGPSRSADMAASGHLAPVAEEVEHNAQLLSTSARREVLYVDVGVLGTREALEGVSCRLAVLSVELWYGIQEIAQVPIMLVHESVALSPCELGLRQPAAAAAAASEPAGRCPASSVGAALNTAAGAPAAAPAPLGASPEAETMGLAAAGSIIATSPSTGNDIAAAVVEELSWLAAVAAGAAAGSSSEDEQCVRQMITDLGTLELYAVSQCLRSAEKFGGEDDGEAARGGSSGQGLSQGRDHASVMSSDAALAGDWPSSYSLSLPLSSPPDVADGFSEADRQHLNLAHNRATPAAVLLSGSVDMSAQLQRLLGRTDSQQRQAMLLVGANLLAYSVLHAMRNTSNVIRKALSALGCGLAEAEELSASAAEVREREDGCDDADASDGYGGAAGTAELGGAEVEWNDFDDDGLPLVHLAVLSGSLSIVRMVLQWAAEDGLGAGWVTRRHRGRSPLQLAAAAAVAGGSRSSSVHAEYLEQLRQLLPVEQSGHEDAPGQAVTTMAEAPPRRALTAAAAAVVEEEEEEEEKNIRFSMLPNLRRLLTEGGVSSCAAAGESSAMSSASTSTAVTAAAASVPVTPAVVGLQPLDMLSYFGPRDEGGCTSWGGSPGGWDLDIKDLSSSLRNLAERAAPDSSRSGLSNNEPHGDRDSFRVAWPRGDDGAAAAAVGHATAGSTLTPHCETAADLMWHCQRHPLVSCLLGYMDPDIEARYQQYALRYDVRVASYWTPCLCVLSACSVFRLLRSSDESNDTYPSMIPVALLFAWPYMVMVAVLMLRPYLVYRQLPSWWLLCGAARISIKWPLSFHGLVSMPPALMHYMRSSLTTVADTLLPALCERVPGLAGLSLRLLDAAVHGAFLLYTGLVPSLSAATMHALLRCAVYVGAALIVEMHYRASFEMAARAAAEVAAAPAGRRQYAGGADLGPPCM